MKAKKNILFICTDQQRTDTLKAYNADTLCRTPVLDRLAGESVVFDNAYASCPVCTPARSSMQCGLYPSKTGMETNTFQPGARVHEIQDGPSLLSRRLNAAGYQAGYTGKWHLCMENGPFVTLPSDVGYIGDDFPGHGAGGWAYPQFRQYLKEHNLELAIQDRTPPKKPGDHSTFGEVTSSIESTIEYYLVEQTIHYIEEFRRQDKPFYFQLNFWGPHEPFYAPTEYLDLYRHMPIPPWKSFYQDPDSEPALYELIRRREVDWDFFQETLRHYYACMTHIDHQLGRLFAYLKEQQLYEDTVIIFSADHGDNQGSHGKLENKSYSMYDETTKIPLFIKPAGKDYESYTQSAFVGTCDIYATILDQAGIGPLADYGYGDGRVLTPFIHDRNYPWNNEIVTEGMGAFEIVATQRMYRKDKYKYVFNAGDKEQLFDMEADPDELDNLAYQPAYQQVLLQIKNDFAVWMTANGDIIRNAYCKMNRLKEYASL